MYPGMLFLILSRDPDFVSDMTELLQSRQGVVYVASSWAEADRLAEEMIFEMLVVDPFYRPVG